MEDFSAAAGDALATSWGVLTGFTQPILDAIYNFGLVVDSIVVHSIVRNLLTLVALVFYDRVIVRNLGNKYRWFRIHAFANLLVVLTSLNSIVTSFRDPHHALDSAIYNDTSMFGCASKCVSSLHNR